MAYNDPNTDGAVIVQREVGDNLIILTIFAMQIWESWLSIFLKYNDDCIYDKKLNIYHLYTVYSLSICYIDFTITIFPELIIFNEQRMHSFQE